MLTKTNSDEFKLIEVVDCIEFVASYSFFSKPAFLITYESGVKSNENCLLVVSVLAILSLKLDGS